MRLNDILLILVALAGIGMGIGVDQIGLYIKQTVLYMMMTILFMSFLKIDLSALLRFTSGDLLNLGIWVLVKLIALPVVLWGLAMWLYPQYALAVLLLSGISTGVTAPFFAVLLGADIALVLKVCVTTSLLVPLTLPALVKLLMGQAISISFAAMAGALVLIILIPFALSLLTRRFLPKAAEFINRIQFPVSLVLFFFINWGVFAGYSSFLLDHRWDLAAAVGVACMVAVAYSGTGYLLGLVLSGGRDRISGAVMMTFINNVLVIVFASEFFGEQFPEAPLLAAMYLVPFFLIVIPLRALAGSKPRDEG